MADRGPTVQDIREGMQQVRDDAVGIKSVLERMERSRSSNTTTVRIEGGGVGVWIATTACCVMIAVSMLLSLWVVDLSRKVERLSDYLQAIYAQAPQLKPDEDQ